MSAIESTTAPAPRISAAERLEVNASWLLRLRWVAVIGQLLTVGVATLAIGLRLQVVPLLSVIGFTAATNVAFAWWLRAHAKWPESARLKQDHWVLGGIMGLDLISLTLLLYFSGGPANPFTIFYFVNLALAAVVLPKRASWSLLLVALVCLGFLFARHVPVPELTRPVWHGSQQQLALQHAGLVTAVALCAGVAVYFITRVTSELQRREEQLRAAELQRARSQRLEALATLAAGAGHELASPLSTIAVIAKELSKHLEGTSVPPSVLEDVRLIRSELDQCRKILDGMTSSAGQATGEELRPVTVRHLLDEVLSTLHRRSRVRVDLSTAIAQQKIVVPITAAANSVRGLIRNGLDASAEDRPVEVTATSESGMLRLKITDHGSGMPPDVLARAGEPFFTTKEPGKGMGLGLFLAQNLCQRLGGDMLLESQPQAGTTATIRLPLA